MHSHSLKNSVTHRVPVFVNAGLQTLETGEAVGRSLLEVVLTVSPADYVRLRELQRQSYGCDPDIARVYCRVSERQWDVARTEDGDLVAMMTYVPGSPEGAGF